MGREGSPPRCSAVLVLLGVGVVDVGVEVGSGEVGPSSVLLKAYPSAVTWMLSIKWGSRAPAPEQSRTNTDGSPSHERSSYTDTGI